MDRVSGGMLRQRHRLGQCLGLCRTVQGIVNRWLYVSVHAAELPRPVNTVGILLAYFSQM